MTHVLTLDVGKTGCRAALWRDGVRLGVSEAPGAVGIAEHDGVEQALERVDEAWRDLAEQHPDSKLSELAAGLAGLASAPARRGELEAELRRRHPEASVVTASDAVMAHVGALSGGPGVVLAAGTGVAALAVADDGSHALVDGWGYLLGDAGSGYAIGRAGLDQALREHDGRGGSTSLAQRATARWGDLRGLPRAVHGEPNPARVVASFAPEVFAAANEGDVAALRICDEAAADLARSVGAAARRVGTSTSVEVATTGGLLHAGTVLTDPFERHLAAELPGTRRRPADGDALAGAHLMATRADLPHHRLASHPLDEGPTP